MPYVGGSYLEQSSIITASLHKHTAALDNPLSDVTLRALNAVQDTPWAIEREQAEVLHEAWEGGLEFAKLPRAVEEPVPERLADDVWASMTPDQQADHKTRLADLHKKNAKATGRRAYLLDLLATAREIGDRTIWFKHRLDFRTRMYAAAHRGPHPQANDLGKSLIRFRRGKTLGARGLHWLMVRAANCGGQDKLPLAERVAWTQRHQLEIEQTAKDPLGMRHWWAGEKDGKALFDEPWSFLATARELAQAWSLENPERFVSHLPIPLDGSCNGLQHLAALALDPRGAQATNLTASPIRYDIYVEVLETVKRLIKDEALAGDPKAVYWMGRLGRSVVKRSVMTTPYGVTPLGIRDQLIADGHVGDLARGSERSEMAGYLRDRIVLALGETVVSAKLIMGWLQNVAKAYAVANQPLMWMTPVGSTILQSYYKLTDTRVTTVYGSLKLWAENPTAGLSASKAYLAAAPNVIHSFDAAHLQMTVDTLSALGIRDFAMIHDSYGTHAAETDLMGQALRECFVEIYQGNQLDRLYQGFLAMAPELDLPTPPTRGDFDINQVLKSEFFFA